MNPLLTVLLAMATKPYHAVSKPTIQAWARFRPAGGRLLGWLRQWARASSRVLASEYGAVKLGDPPAKAGAALPENSEELAEFLADDKKSQAAFATPEARAEFLARHQELVNKAAPDLQALLADEIKKGLDSAKKDWGVNRPDLTTETMPLAQKGAAYNKHALGAVLDNEFESAADFLKSIWHKNMSGTEKWRQIHNDYSSIDPSTGGFLVPEVLRAELLRVALESAIVRSRARVIPMDSPTVPFPTIDATSHASSVFGGVIGYWTEEGAELAETEAKFGKITLQASKLTTRCDVPNELLADSIISFEAFIQDILPQAIAWFEDTAFITGSGVGQPLGVLEAAALVTVAKETGQPADTIAWENIVNMYSRMLPASLGSAVWLANLDCFPQLATMSLSVGTGGSAIWLNNGVVGPPMTILGRPVIFTEKVPTIGGAGSGKDISFIDFGYYLIGDRMQMRAESSAHAQFINDRTVYRVIERVDGRPWLQSSITPQNSSNDLSPFVTLGERGT